MTDSRKGYVRMRTLQAVVLLIFGVIILRLAYIQLIDPKYEKLARGNALRHVVQYPPRGEIFDRNGEYLAQNRVCYDLMVIYRELPREGFDTLQMLDLLGISRTKLERALRNARMNVGYTELRSPIDGIIEHTAAHVGDYVGPGTQFSVLTTVSNIDTLTVDVAIPMSQYLRYAGDRTSIYDNEGLLSDIRLVLADGSRYPLGGIYDYTRKDVSSTTGTLVVVVMFPNPDETLKPGQFARVEASVGPVRPRVVVPQQAVLFTGTIRDNMQWAAPGASDEEIWQALEIAQAAEFVRGKPGMLDAPVETAGRNFSGGQRQRLTIARALVRKPEILILDDSASALDYATDAHLRRAIRQMENPPTTFIVSQRAASVRFADQIIVLDDGRVAGMGTHDELLAACPVYQEIYASQFKKEGN